MLLRERLLRERLSRESEGVRGPSAGSEEVCGLFLLEGGYSFEGYALTGANHSNG